jgi:hypothetical protein
MFLANALQEERRARQDNHAFAALTAAPGDLVVGFALPANAEVYVSTSSVLVVTTALINVEKPGGTRDLHAPASAAETTHHVGRLERGVNVVKAVGAPGTVSVYMRNALGRLIKIGEG